MRMVPVSLLMLASLVVAAVAGCANAPKLNDTAAPMIAVRLATVGAIQGDPVRAQHVADTATQLIADIDAGQSIALDVLVPALNTRLAQSTLPPAERTLLVELVNTVAAVVQAQSALPQDTRERLRLVLTWVRAAALGQAAVLPPEPEPEPASV